MLSLTGDLDLVAEQLGEHCGRGERPVHDHSPAPLARKRPHDEQLLRALVDEPERASERERARARHDRLDPRLAFPRTDHLGRYAPAAQQRHGRQQDRFAGARLPGEHSQSRAELELELLDHGQVVDPEGLDHRDPQPSFVRTISK